MIARAHTLAQWHDWTAFAAVQLPYNLLQEDVERELLPAAEALGLSVATWGPLAGGVLSGKFTASTTPATGPTRVAANSLGDRERRIAAAVDAGARELGVSSAQVAIAWTRTRSRSVHPILGARTLADLDYTRLYGRFHICMACREEYDDGLTRIAHPTSSATAMSFAVGSGPSHTD